MPDPHTSDAILASMIKWKRDIIVATHPKITGNREDTPLHMVIIAMLGAWRKEWPMLHISGAKIKQDGTLFALIELSQGDGWRVGQLGQVEHVRDALRRVADFCKLDDIERTLMLDSFRRWIRHDARANDPHKQRVLAN
jgi:hypothetical protein